MFFTKTAGKRILIVAVALSFAVLLILPAVLAAFILGGQEDTVSQTESETSVFEQTEPEPDYEQPVSPQVIVRPVITPTEKTTVDVGLYYGYSCLSAFTLSAAEGSVLSFGGDVSRTAEFTWQDGVMYLNGNECEKVLVRSSAPITFSRTGWSYEGSMIITNTPRGIKVVNRVDLETYVKGVMSGEIGEDGSYESRKAFAVICRTLVFTAKDHGEDFDLCSKNCCQSYRGTYHRHELNDKAVDDTKGLVLTYEGEPCLVSYSSSHGYNSCSSYAAWVGADIPYLRVVRYENEPLDYGGRWEVTYTYEQLSNRLKHYTTTGKVASVTVGETDPFGSTYVYKLKVVDTAGNVSEVVYGGNIMAVLGVRCANFTIEQTGDGITIHGIGNGHGVGYSQRGGHQLGVEGYTWDMILSFYFPGTKVKEIKMYN